MINHFFPNYNPSNNFGYVISFHKTIYFILFYFLWLVKAVKHFFHDEKLKNLTPFKDVDNILCAKTAIYLSHNHPTDLIPSIILQSPKFKHPITKLEC